MALSEPSAGGSASQQVIEHTIFHRLSFANLHL
jgi:hypothetical protein